MEIKIKIKFQIGFVLNRHQKYIMNRFTLYSPMSVLINGILRLYGSFRVYKMPFIYI